MSYILDALRKADAQRERDPARGIHAQPVRAATGDRRLHGGYRVGFGAATAAGVAALASVGWYLYRDSGVAPVAPAARTEVVVAAATPASVRAPASPAAAVVPAPVLAPATAVLPPPVVMAPPVPAKAGPAPVSRGAARQPSENSPAGAAVVRRAAPPAAPAIADTAAPIAGLPADAPKVAISGGVYSAKAAQRMLIVNGQVFNEGGEVGPGLVLEEIRPKAAVIRFRGSRYTVAY